MEKKFASMLTTRKGFFSAIEALFDVAVNGFFQSFSPTPTTSPNVDGKKKTFPSIFLLVFFLQKKNFSTVTLYFSFIRWFFCSTKLFLFQMFCFFVRALASKSNCFFIFFTFVEMFSFFWRKKKLQFHCFTASHFHNFVSCFQKNAYLPYLWKGWKGLTVMLSVNEIRKSKFIVVSNFTFEQF